MTAFDSLGLFRFFQVGALDHDDGACQYLGGCPRKIGGQGIHCRIEDKGQSCYFRNDDCIVDFFAIGFGSFDAFGRGSFVGPLCQMGFQHFFLSFWCTQQITRGGAQAMKEFQ
eukprot:CAMPEP_0172448850 /NCGR_PEP_ID=MMETSP1065-20121228/7764_1 /TAXON_ID=265537 /ORGANISM="Amphiprora paludosa, Strain CCMP125" /LENGTH=112 /DNA_ID=CAMNT_0013200439 /DNA_START=776 /DNA_END=1114 /DNA_ORIENTATION=-